MKNPWKKIKRHEDLPPVGKVVEVRWCDGRKPMKGELTDRATADWFIHGFCRTRDVSHWREVAMA